MASWWLKNLSEKISWDDYSILFPKYEDVPNHQPVVFSIPSYFSWENLYGFLQVFVPFAMPRPQEVTTTRWSFHRIRSPPTIGFVQPLIAHFPLVDQVLPALPASAYLGFHGALPRFQTWGMVTMAALSESHICMNVILKEANHTEVSCRKLW